MFRNLMWTESDWAATILRVTLGVIFLAHGAQKVLGWFGGYGFSASMGFFTHQMGIPWQGGHGHPGLHPGSFPSSMLFGKPMP